jgi:hypothetical protein
LKASIKRQQKIRFRKEKRQGQRLLRRTALRLKPLMGTNQRKREILKTATEIANERGKEISSYFASLSNDDLMNLVETLSSQKSTLEKSLKVGTFNPFLRQIPVLLEEMFPNQLDENGLKKKEFSAHYFWFQEEPHLYEAPEELNLFVSFFRKMSKSKRAEIEDMIQEETISVAEDPHRIFVRRVYSYASKQQHLKENAFFFLHSPRLHKEVNRILEEGPDASISTQVITAKILIVMTISSQMPMDYFIYPDYFSATWEHARFHFGGQSYLLGKKDMETIKAASDFLRLRPNAKKEVIERMVKIYLT